MGDAEDAWVEVEDNEVPVNQNPEVLTKNYDLGELWLGEECSIDGIRKIN